ncbi:Putative Flp pilus-assembly TadE/G-like [Sulfitobacter marinus]|uniref:Putative Flp pilus-assembly TadE/G-like n=1 Tax=Sulfitobacter marinus TaxID=394264 RepID=A0A1I6RV79_9RHOB|nr:Tad domain-containing protein [Sulfitobacter marinus]SFS68582.1 Putative Flp pilus-assembly TadE/G-like [Sulfitobacter marinus]
MSPALLTMKTLRNATALQARRFAREEDGIMTVWVLFVVLMMVMVGGIQLDFMRHELERSKLQAVSDRAVLAASDLDQTLDPEDVVKDYFAKSGMTEYLSNVTVNDGLNFRTVTVDATKPLDTPYLRKFGFDTLDVPAHSQAEERVANVEISLVLDISGSMAQGSRISNMRDAAKVFIDTVLRDETEDLISISLVPYSEHVNAGPLITDRMKMYTKHNYSHCVEFDDNEFKSAALDLTKWHDQAQHFQWSYNGRNNDRSETVCPRYSYERIQPLSQSNRALKNQIDDLRPRVGTSIFMGMKWGAAMLDPSFRPINDSLVAAREIDREFKGRPADYDDAETLKTVILMTDGENTTSHRIVNRHYNSSSEYVHWDRYNLNWYLQNYVSYWDRSDFYWRKYDHSLGNRLLDDICTAAKAKRIVIWTIGFEVNDNPYDNNDGADVMRKCASSPSHFFKVEGVELSEAFKAIARQINQLRLIQ